MRTTARRGGTVVLARSEDGERLAPLAALDKDRFGAESLERPALVRLDGAGEPPPGAILAGSAAPAADVRYLDVLPLPDGGHRLHYEAPLPDGSHELRTELIPRA